MEKEKALKVSVRDVVEFLFLPVLSAGVFVLWDLNKNVNDLNIKVAVLIANNSTYETRIVNLENEMKEMKKERSGDLARTN